MFKADLQKAVGTKAALVVHYNHHPSVPFQPHCCRVHQTCSADSTLHACMETIAIHRQQKTQCRCRQTQVGKYA